MVITLGELIDALEKIRQENDSATTVSLDIGNYEKSIDRLHYDKRMDRVFLIPERRSAHQPKATP